MDNLIPQFVEHLKYIGIFGGAFIEGPATALAAGFFVKSHLLQFAPALIAHFLGDFAADMVYFLSGRFGGKKILGWLEHIFHFSNQDVDTMKQRFQKHHLKIIFTGKLTHFLGLPAIVGIGMSGYSWKKFFIFNLLATFIKSALLLAAGYSAGSLWQKQESFISRLGLVILLLAFFLSAYFLFKRRKNANKI